MPKRFLTLFAVASLGVATLIMIGCTDRSAPPADLNPPVENQETAAHEPMHMPAAGGDHAGHDQEAMSRTEANQAKLSPELQQLAKKQQVCPVSGEPLGSMGVPYHVTVQDRDVLLCCSGCESDIKANPELYLAKLPQE